MNITKKVCIYILVGLITLTGTFTSFYKGVYAFEYVGGALAFEEAIKWLLASVGIISAGGMTADYWEIHGHEFEDYCAQQNITDADVADWQLKLCQGILDKGSECWQAFKQWSSTLTGSSSGSGSGVLVEGGSYVVDNIRLNVSSFNAYYNTYTISNYNYTGYFTSTATTFSNPISHFIIASDTYFNNPAIANLYSSGANGFTYNGKTVYYVYSARNYYLSVTPTIENFIGNTNNIFSDNTQEIKLLAWLSVYGSSGVSDSDFVSVQSDVTDLDIISSPIPDTDAQEVAIPMPGVADSDNDASASAYDDIIDAVNDGTLDLDDGITRIQEILKVIVYDDTNDKIFPTPEDPEDQEDLQDKINENKDNMGFTLGGLETVFPFCIPWDIYAFMGLLRADPVPPKVELPFPNPLDPENPWLVEVDFSDWDDGMRILRLAEDFLFIIGLAVLTRSLIGAGGGDG